MCTSSLNELVHISGARGLEVRSSKSVLTDRDLKPHTCASLWKTITTVDLHHSWSLIVLVRANAYRDERSPGERSPIRRPSGTVSALS